MINCEERGTALEHCSQYCQDPPPSGPTATTNAVVKRFVKKWAGRKKGGEGTDTADGAVPRMRVVQCPIFT